MAGPLDRATRDIRVGTQSAVRVMYGTYLVWEAPTGAPAFTVKDWGSGSSFPSEGESRQVVVTGGGIPNGARFGIDDMTATQPAITVYSWGGIARGDLVTIVFENAAVTYDSPRTIQLYRN